MNIQDNINRTLLTAGSMVTAYSLTPQAKEHAVGKQFKAANELYKEQMKKPPRGRTEGAIEEGLQQRRVAAANRVLESSTNPELLKEAGKAVAQSEREQMYERRDMQRRNESRAKREAQMKAKAEADALSSLFDAFATKQNVGSQAKTRIAILDALGNEVKSNGKE